MSARHVTSAFAPRGEGRPTKNPLLPQRLAAVVVPGLPQHFLDLRADRLGALLDADIAQHHARTPLRYYFGNLRPFSEARAEVRHAAVPRGHHRRHERIALLNLRV